MLRGAPRFDPYSALGAFVKTLVDELIATGHDIKRRSYRARAGCCWPKSVRIDVYVNVN